MTTALVTIPMFAEGNSAALAAVREAFHRAERIEAVENMRRGIAESYPDAAAGRFRLVTVWPEEHVILDAILDANGEVLVDDIEFDDPDDFSFSDRDEADVMLESTGTQNGVSSEWLLRVDGDGDVAIEEVLPDASVLAGVLPDVFARELLLALVNRFVIA